MMTDDKERADAAEDGLFRVVQALGYDVDGARNASEFFGPLSIHRGRERISDPAGIAVYYANDHREDAERETDKYEVEIARLKERADDAWEVIRSDHWRNRYDEDMARGNAYVDVLRNRLRSALSALKEERARDGA